MAKNILILVNAAPYGSERSFSALRIAATLTLHDERPNVRLFFMSDAVGIAVSGQGTAEIQTHELMLREIIGDGAEVKLCKSCVSARGLQNAKWIEGVSIGSLDDLARWTLEADSTLCF